MKVTIDTAKCIASGQCVLNAPDVFDQRDEDGIVVLLNPNPPAGAEDDVQAGRRALPGAGHHDRVLKPMPRRVVIVGACAAGLSAAQALRRRGYDGALTLIGDESRTPYDRPPLSKQVLAGVWGPEKLALRDEQTLGQLGADLVFGQAAVGLDVAGRSVRLAGGGGVGYDALVIATGVTPRRLTGAGMAGVHVLRTMDDALSLRERLLARPQGRRARSGLPRHRGCRGGQRHGPGGDHGRSAAGAHAPSVR